MEKCDIGFLLDDIGSISMCLGLFMFLCRDLSFSELLEKYDDLAPKWPCPRLTPLRETTVPGSFLGVMRTFDMDAKRLECP